MRHLMTDDRLDLIPAHGLEQPRGHRHQRGILEGASGEGIGLAFIDGDLGHVDACLLGEPRHGAHDPLVTGVR